MSLAQPIEQIFETARRFNENRGVVIPLMEQNTNIARRYATCGAIRMDGQIVFTAAAGAPVRTTDFLRRRPFRARNKDRTNIITFK